MTREPLQRAAPAARLAERLLEGDRLALSRLISVVEENRSDAQSALQSLFQHTGRAHRIGITGPPGSGKSTLTGAVAKAFRKRGETVGVVAVDPTSPFTGGALLGDRIRLMDLHADTGVFVRSMATRGRLGGLARSTLDVVALMDAFGIDNVIVETVGVGQDEVEIARAADTTVVVSVPGLGDDIQALKAGILEIADVLVVNKADLPGGDRLVKDLQAMLSLGRPRVPEWVPPIRETVATNGAGVAELVASTDAHRAYLQSSGAWRARRADAARYQVRALVEDAILAHFDRLASENPMQERFAAIAERQQDPYSVAEEARREVMLSNHE